MMEYLKPDFDFGDERGILKQLCHKDCKQVNYLLTKKGTFRGNHYHKINKETFFVIDGKFKLNLVNKNGKEEVYIINTNDFFVINPFVMHSMTFIENTSMIAFYDKGINADGIKDIYKEF